MVLCKIQKPHKYPLCLILDWKVIRLPTTFNFLNVREIRNHFSRYDDTFSLEFDKSR